MPDIRLSVVQRPFAVRLSPPGSKSLTNRALVIAAQAAGRSRLSNILFADDTRVMLESLRKLGFDMAIDPAQRTVDIVGRSGSVPASDAELFCGNSGTTIRFLSALCSLGHGRFVLDGIARMRERPIGELVALLRNLGTRVNYLEREGFPPIEIHADALAGGIVRFGAAQSSQYLSAVLMVSPYARHEVTVDLDPNQTSWPYVTMTMRLMDDFGNTCHLIRDPQSGDPRQVIVPRGQYQARDYVIEPDASNATYFLAAAAIHPGSEVTVERLDKNSLQGDVGFADVLRRMGAGVSYDRGSITVKGAERLRAIDVDLSAMPDTAQTLAVAALFADGTSVIRGLRTLRVKETDRLAALSTELSKLGARAEIVGDALEITPPGRLQAAEIDTYDDHRMAMSFALAATKIDHVVIRDAQCVAKTYPEFFEEFRAALGG